MPTAPRTSRARISSITPDHHDQLSWSEPASPLVDTADFQAAFREACEPVIHVVNEALDRGKAARVVFTIDVYSND